MFKEVAPVSGPKRPGAEELAAGDGVERAEVIDEIRARSFSKLLLYFRSAFAIKRRRASNIEAYHPRVSTS